MKLLELKVPPLLLTIIFGLLMSMFSMILPTIEIGEFVRISISLVILLTGIYFCVYGLIEFKKQKTTVDPRFPENVTTLVDSGVYSISRNPMYVGFALFLVTIVVFLESPFLILGVIGFILYMNSFQIVPEELVLSDLFGEKYTQYKSRVRRWV